MIEYRVYKQAKGRKSAPRLAATCYREAEAIAEAGRIALAGAWATITKVETAEASRWD